MQARIILTLLVSVLSLAAETPSRWLALVSPIMSPAEQARYRSLAPQARASFESEFWATKAISQADYFERLQVADDRYGSGKQGSGLNTDQGRVYISIGPPNRITRVPSSRSFYPVEIWYYESVPALQISSELRLLFYQKNGLGDFKLYSPTLDRITSLMTPQSSTIGMFGPNQSITQADVATQLTTRPVENEIAEAALSVAQGIHDVGNEEILTLVASPARALARSNQRSVVQSRLLLAHAPIQILQTHSRYGGTQVDLCFQLNVHHTLQLEIRAAELVLYRGDSQFAFDRSLPIRYRHRLDLLPGDYSLIVTADGKPSAYPLHVPVIPPDSEIMLAEEVASARGGAAPFSFAGRSVSPSSRGTIALLATTDDRAVSWLIRRGNVAVWKTEALPNNGVSLIDLPLASLPPAAYTIEASTSNGTRILPLNLAAKVSEPAEAAVSYNANLTPAQRYLFTGHQWLARAKYQRARQDLEASLAAQPSGNDEALVELSRLDASQGNLDVSRQRLRDVLSRHPHHFEALTALAYVEAQLQDYPLAATLYRQALTIQDSPTVRLALDKLPLE